MIILAHRTGMLKGSENSIAGLKKCFSDGAKGAECDITFFDGEPFAWVDGMKKHLVDCPKSISKMNPVEISSLKRKDCDESILSIHDIFDFIEELPSSVRIYFDVKFYSLDIAGEFRTVPPGMINQVVEKIIRPAEERNICHKIGFVTFGGGFNLLRKVKKINPQIATNLIVINPYAEIKKYAKYLDSISIGWKAVNHWRIACSPTGIIEEARACGVKVYGGIANSEKEILWLARKMRVDGVWTDDVETTKKIIHEYHETKEENEKMKTGRKILVTGSEGYLATKLIDRLLADESVSQIIGIDIRHESRRRDKRYRYINMSVTEPYLIEALKDIEFNLVVHTAWTFNPTHNLFDQDLLDISGTVNILNIAKYKKADVVYLGSTTCYGPLPENPSEEPFLKEEDWWHNYKKRKSVGYRYSKNKAIVDEIMQNFSRENPDINVFWIRGSIVVGPYTNNIVSYLAESPFTFGKYMFRVRGYDPLMQFLSEDDMNEVLYRACTKGWSGVVNVAGRGTVKYSEVIKTIGRKELCLPWWILYLVTDILWKLRLFKFPSNLIDLIRYPWVADTSRLNKYYGFTPKHSSREALEQFARAKTKK